MSADRGGWQARWVRREGSYACMQNACMHAFMHACMHTYIHTYTHTHMHACTHTVLLLWTSRSPTPVGNLINMFVDVMHAFAYMHVLRHVCVCARARACAGLHIRDSNLRCAARASTYASMRACARVSSNNRGECATVWQAQRHSHAGTLDWQHVATLRAAFSRSRSRFSAADMV